MVDDFIFCITAYGKYNSGTFTKLLICITTNKYADMQKLHKYYDYDMLIALEEGNNSVVTSAIKTYPARTAPLPYFLFQTFVSASAHSYFLYIYFRKLFNFAVSLSIHHPRTKYLYTLQQPL